MTRLSKSALALLALGLFACGQTAGQAEEPGDTSAELEQVDATLAEGNEVIADPGHEDMNQTAPDEFDALFHTTAGDFTVRVHREWAPLGADRFYNLVVNGYYDGTRFFRVVPGFVVQWGMHGDPAVNAAWRASDDANIQDDPVTQSNVRGTVTFATSGPNSRTTQLFINYGNNARLDGMGFSVFGEVIGDGMEAVDSIESKYGQRPDQGRIHAGGNEYLDENFPDLDHIISATIVEPEGDDAAE
ncbi:MAG: peptidylprolyl isomerase [Phycisphaerales bacterium JB063]